MADGTGSVPSAHHAPVLITPQYWVVYAFLTVLESLINAAYWFRTLILHPLVPSANPGAAYYYVFKFVLVLWMALPVTNGAQVVFRSFLLPVLSPFFAQSASTASELRGKVDAATKSQ